MTIGVSLPHVAEWIDVGALDDIPRRGARVVRTMGGDVAVFRTATDAIYAIDDLCPHRGGPLSQGIVHGNSVTCPLHNWVIDLSSGKAEGADDGCVRTIGCRVEGDRIFLALAAVLGEAG
jgi:nitrite reductase (NADH) small subunit